MRTMPSSISRRGSDSLKLCLALLAALPLLSGCELLGGLFPPQGLHITGRPTGCGVKVNDTKTVSWSIAFTAEGIEPGASVQWFFSDGGSATGESVVHSFDTAALETSPTAAGEHNPTDFDVTVTVNGESVTQSFEVPLRGDLDGGPEPSGDVCIIDDGRTHVADGTKLCYSVNPPASGPHYSAAGVAPVPPGFYDEALATERWVHNLEHGCVILLYDCDGTCSTDIKNDLQDLFDAVPVSERFNEKKIVITRYAGVPAACSGTETFPASGPFLAIAWDVQRSFDTLDVDGILDFYARHVDHGPEDQPIPP